MMSSISLKTFSLKKHVRREGGGLTTKRLGFGWRAHSETWTQEPNNRRGLIGGLETWRERERAETQICTQSGMQREEVGIVEGRLDNQLTGDLIGFQQRR